MRSYQIIILIGTILEILIVIDSSMFLGEIVPDTIDYMSLKEQNMSLYGKIDVAFILYIIILMIAFAVKKY